MLTELDLSILQTILRADAPVSSKYLAGLYNVAINTVRKEIEMINAEIRAHGFSIEMKSSVGVYPVITDETLAIPYMERQRIYYNRSHHLERMYPARIHYLTRRCLCGGRNLTVNRLCEELYTSKGTLLRELNQVRDILGEFGLELKNPRGGSLAVAGSEWDIRQCLVFQHKVYRIAQQGGTAEDFGAEHTFRALFHMDDDCYERVHSSLRRLLPLQSDFSLPVIHIPKVANMLLLCATRKRHAEGLAFSPEDGAQVKATAEYAFLRQLCAQLPRQLADVLGEDDYLQLAAILLAFEDQNDHLEELPRWPEYRQEAEELIDYLTARTGLREESFDQVFRRGLICRLYQLENCRRFGIHSDPEPIGQVRQMGLQSGDLCVAFSQFYAQRHGVTLHRRDVMGLFYLFQRVNSHDRYCYYGKNALVVSEYGIDCARSMADMLLRTYGPSPVGEAGNGAAGQIYRAEARTVNQVSRGVEDWDLIITDLSASKAQTFLPGAEVPVLSIEYHSLLAEGRDKNLDAYLDQARQEEELTVLREKVFHRTALENKEEVFAYLAGQLKGTAGLDDTDVADYLRRADELADLERENGMIFFPIFCTGPCEPRVVVLLNKSPIPWDHHKSQIFVGYTCGSSRHSNRVTSAVLKKLLYMSQEMRSELLEDTGHDPMLLFYPDE